MNEKLFHKSAAVLSFLYVVLLGAAPCGTANADALAIGRPVRVVSLCFHSKPLNQILELVDREGARGADLIVLPETWRGQNDQSLEPVDGPTIQSLSRLAKKHHTYIVSPIDAERDGRRFNTAVVLNRDGKVAGDYNKVYPYWSEFDHSRPVQPGKEASVIETDFGKLGMSICFDVNFPEVWQQLDDKGAELVLWSSAYSAGQHLQAYALLHHYYIVTSTWTRDCQAYDLTGQRLLDEKSSDITVARITLDLDRGIYHSNFNESKRDTLLKEHGEDVLQETFLDREQWFILRAKRPGVSARALAKQYGLEELRDYISRSRREIDKMRVRTFSEIGKPGEGGK